VQRKGEALVLDAGGRESNSAEQTRNRFNSEVSARKYARSLHGTATHRREMLCVRRVLGGLPAGSKVLDLPSGSGRLLPLLVEMGFRVTEADSSSHMLEHARDYAQTRGIAQGVEFRVEDAFRTSFKDDAFDAILCNRLFHHFREPEVRRRCLRELGRICRGPIVVSFFCNCCLGALMFRLRNWLRRRTPTDRIPIPRKQFLADTEAAGLRVVQTMATRRWIAKQWYALLERPQAEAAQNTSISGCPHGASRRPNGSRTSKNCFVACPSHCSSAATRFRVFSCLYPLLINSRNSLLPNWPSKDAPICA